MKSMTPRPVRSSRHAPHSDNDSAPGSPVRSGDVSEESDPSDSSDDFSDSDMDAVSLLHKVGVYIIQFTAMRRLSLSVVSESFLQLSEPIALR